MLGWFSKRRQAKAAQAMEAELERSASNAEANAMAAEEALLSRLHVIVEERLPQLPKDDLKVFTLMVCWLMIGHHHPNDQGQWSDG